MRSAAMFLALSLGAAFLSGCAREIPVAGNEEDGPLATDQRAVPVVSLQMGEQPLPFTVEDVTGPAQGEMLCYRCRYANRPTVVVFAREVNDTVSSLVQQIDQQVAANRDKKLSAFMVVVGENAEEAKPDLQRLATAQNLQNTPLTVFHKPEGPPGYGLSPDMPIQVMMWNKEGLKVNRPIAGELSREEIAQVVNATEEILN